MTKKALILGITGQDGSYLADILLERGYEVHGMYRRTSTGSFDNIKHIEEKITLHKGDILDRSSLRKAIEESEPNYIFNEADQDNIDWSRHIPGYSSDVTYRGVINLLEVFHELSGHLKEWGVWTKIFQPCSATQFGSSSKGFQTFNTPFEPESHYAIAKTAAFHTCKLYRKVHGMAIYTALLYNHDSPRRRSEEYLLQKICWSAVRMSRGLQDKLKIGCLDMQVSVGFARDYMEVIVDFLEQKDPQDILLGNNPVSIQSLIEYAFNKVGIYGHDRIEKLVEIDPQFARKGTSTQGILCPDDTPLGRVMGYFVVEKLNEIGPWRAMDRILDFADNHYSSQ